MAHPRAVHRRLSKNDKGADVRQLQHGINRTARHWKLERFEVEVDGKLGPQTLNASTKLLWALGAHGEVMQKARDGNLSEYAQRLLRGTRKRTKEMATLSLARRPKVRKWRLTLGERAFRIAETLVGVVEEGGNNMGKMVNKIIQANGGVIGEPWCFAAGTLVNTPDGLRPIENLRDGDVVLTASGVPAPVLARGERVANTVELRAMGVADTVVSDDHPYEVRRNRGRPGHPDLGDPEWVPVGEIRRGDFIRLPSLDGGNEPFDPRLAYVFGRWLADGWTVVKAQRETQEHRAAFVCCSHAEADGLRGQLADAGVLGAERKHPTVTQFALPVRALPFWESGGNARSKRVPGAVLRWNAEAREALLRGYLDGDGHEYAPGRFAANTVSRALAYGIAQVARSLGRSAAVYAYERDTEAVIDGRTVSQAPVRYEVKITPESQHSHGEWVPVRAVEPAGERAVFNLTVAGEPTFIADGAAVHNCGDFVAYCYRNAGSTAVQRLWASVYYLGLVSGLKTVTEPKRGDIVRYSFDHTGLFDKWGDGGYFYAIEGNTGPTGAVSDSSTGGDGVYRKRRHISQVNNFRRVLR